jgi:hypothetical protein
MASWGHRIRVASERERDNYARWGGNCSSAKCKNPDVRYITSYTYITGRRGRTTEAEKLVCLEHAQRFGEKHGLALPNGPGVDRQTSFLCGEFVGRLERACQWFALCDNPATGHMPHPILGSVPICDRCRAKVEALSASNSTRDGCDLGGWHDPNAV